MQAVATWRKNHEFLLEDGRAHAVIIDLPPEDGGASAGTTPSELTVLALAGSLASTFLSLARKRHMDCVGLTVVLEGEPKLAEPVPGALRGTLRLRTHADRTDVEATLQATLEVCPVARLFREARVSVNVTAAVSPIARSP